MWRVLGIWPLREWLSQECFIFINGINAFSKEVKGNTFVPCARRYHLWGTGLSPNTKFTAALILHIQPPELWNIYFCCSFSLCLKYFVAAWMHYDTFIGPLVYFWIFSFNYLWVSLINQDFSQSWPVFSFFSFLGYSYLCFHLYNI